MKRVWKISDTVQAKAELLALRRWSPSLSPPTIPTPYAFNVTRFPVFRFIRYIFAQTSPSPDTVNLNLSNLFPDRPFSSAFKARKFKEEVSRLKDELLECAGDREKVSSLLQQKGIPLFRAYNNGLGFLELMNHLNRRRQLALEVFDWRRKHAPDDIPLTSEEYAKAIMFAGRNKNIDLAVKLFNEATNKNLKSTSTYNALMGACMYNGLAEKCQSVFRDLKMDLNCRPTIATYNLLISLFGGLMLVDHMEETFREIKNSNLSPNTITYNNLISGYLTAWMWERMEHIFHIMKAFSFGPDMRTYLLMLRGYAHSGNLRKMEETYELIKYYVDRKEIALIRAMILAYCKSSAPDKLRKIESLTKLIPKKEYRQWLNVSLIHVYAKEGKLEAMEDLIHEALQHSIPVHSFQVMRAIISVYFEHNAVEKLAVFVTRAECAGWRICRSLYHCKMVMYASQKRLKEMESVLSEMENVNITCTKRTFIILYKAYLMCGQRYKVEKILGLMYKYGYENFLFEIPS